MGEPDEDPVYLEPGTYGLVMPFVCCQSEGGPYDSVSFVAGARFGQDAAEVKALPETWEQWVYPAMVPQYDLLAMHHGYAMTSEPWDEHPDEWVLVRFERAGGRDRDGQ